VVAPAGDVYALGATLYEAAAGKWPRLEAKGALLAPVPPLRQLAPHLSPGIAAAIDRAVSFEAAHRPTAAELADLLAHPANASGPIAAAAPRFAFRWKRWAIGGAAALLLLILATRGGSGSGGSAPPPPVTSPGDQEDIQERAIRDWNHIVDEVRKGHYRGARDKLDDFERNYGETDESRALRDQLPDQDYPTGPPGRGKHGRH
jgi:hypothetical protein